MGYLYITYSTGQRVRLNWITRLNLVDNLLEVDFVMSRNVAFGGGFVKIEVLPE